MSYADMTHLTERQRRERAALDALTGVARVQQATNPGPWTPEYVALLERYWLEGISASQIAARLCTDGMKVSRNGVIGKLHRLGKTSRGQSVNKPKIQAHVRKHKVTHLFDAPMHVLRPEPTPPLPVHEDLDPIRQADGKFLTVLTIKPGLCQFIVGDAAEAVFCGRPSQNGKSFCTGHAQMCYVATPKTRK